jgi:hypothetical protein
VREVCRTSHWQKEHDFILSNISNASLQAATQQLQHAFDKGGAAQSRETARRAYCPESIDPIQILSLDTFYLLLDDTLSKSMSVSAYRISVHRMASLLSNKAATPVAPSPPQATPAASTIGSPQWNILCQHWAKIVQRV